MRINLPSKRHLRVGRNPLGLRLDFWPRPSSDFHWRVFSVCLHRDGFRLYQGQGPNSVDRIEDVAAEDWIVRLVRKFTG